MINDHKQCLYKGTESRDFEAGETIPYGWFDRPNATEWDNPPRNVNAEIRSLTKPKLIQLLADNGIDADSEIHIATLRKMAREL